MNRLIHETSPYLRQHAGNPVDWYPWGPEALARALAEDKPILLSVGYSACHWCHVMEHESFSNAETAALMNADFVCIKVDREERPDLDEIYMHAVQAFTGGHGGWPMTVFLTPDGKPFFGGTYFPPVRRGRMPSFRDVLAHASESYRDSPAEAAAIGAQLLQALSASASPSPSAGPRASSSARASSPDLPLRDDALSVVFSDAKATYDPQFGGFGGAPKFPPHGTLAALLAHHHRSGDGEALAMVEGTLRGLIRGGTWDHLAGGFARYSTDVRWAVPHFEKMLYDQAQLLPPLVDAWRITREPTWERIARETLGFVQRELTLAGGAFASALDADSEGEEGRFYVWTPSQLVEALGATDGSKVAALLEVDAKGSFEHGTSVLRLERPLEQQSDADRALLIAAFPKLLAARAARVRPGLDDKVITAWNGLMIGAFARAGAAFDDPALVAAGAQAADWLLVHHQRDGRLLRTGKVPGFLDDHAFLAHGLLELYEATWDRTWLRRAIALAERILALFADGDELSYVGSDAEPLVLRPRKRIGSAEPSPHALAALVFLRLDALCGRPDLGDRAERMLQAVQPRIGRHPRAVPHEAIATAWRVGPSQEIGLVGPREHDGTAVLAKMIRQRYLPFAVTARVDPGENPADLPWMADRPMMGRPTVYACAARSCRLPVTEPADLANELVRIGSAPARKSVGDEIPRLGAPAWPRDPAAWIGSAPLSIADLRGQIVVIDFWTSCCVNCQHVIPELAAIEDRYAGRPVAVIGVHSAKFPAEQDPTNLARAVERHGIRHPVINDATHELWEQYAVHAWPTVVVLDANGKIAWTRSGEVTRDELGGVIDGLLDEAESQGQRTGAGTSTSTGARAGARTSACAGSSASAGLRFPGKASVWPDAQAQARGADPFGPDARLYVGDSGNHRVVEAGLALGLDGWPVATVLRSLGGVAGFEDGPDGKFRDPQGISRTSDRLYVADTGNHALRVVSLASGAVRTVAGTGRLGRSALMDPLKPRLADLRSPWDVVATEAVALVAMAGTHQIWAYAPGDERFGPFCGTGAESHADGTPEEAALAQPSGLCVYGKFLFWVDAETSSVRLMDLADRTVHSVVGAGLFDCGDLDGPLDDARLQHPLGIAFIDRTLYVADTYNGKIKRIDLGEGVVTTLATGLVEPGGICAAGRFLIVADTGNHRIVAVDRGTGEVRGVM